MNHINNMLTPGNHKKNQPIVKITLLEHDVLEYGLLDLKQRSPTVFSSKNYFVLIKMAVRVTATIVFTLLI